MRVSIAGWTCLWLPGNDENRIAKVADRCSVPISDLKVWKHVRSCPPRIFKPSNPRFFLSFFLLFFLSAEPPSPSPAQESISYPDVLGTYFSRCQFSHRCWMTFLQLLDTPRSKSRSQNEPRWFPKSIPKRNEK